MCLRLYLIILGICYEKNFDYQGIEIAHVHNIPTWEICKSHCRADPACLVWSYATETFVHEKSRKHCYLKTDDNITEYAQGLISGGNKCSKPRSK